LRVSAYPVSTEHHPLDGRGWLRIRQAHHPKGVDDAEERGQEGDEERDLKRDVPRVVVDVDDLVRPPESRYRESSLA
jgi:hypothetical protein